MTSVALLLSSAWAGPCEDALQHLENGSPTGAVARVARSEAFDASELDCLVDAEAPRRVVLAAARGSGLGIPAAPLRTWEVGAGAAWHAGGQSVISGGTLGVQGAWLPADRVAVALTADAVPARDTSQYVDLDWVQLTHLPSEDGADLLISHTAAVELQLAPIAGELGVFGGRAWRIRAFGGVGSALIATREVLVSGASDLHLIDQRQQHVGLQYGGVVRLDPPAGPGLRLSVHQLRWIEASGFDLDSRQLVLLRLGVVARG